jgi:glucosyl-dolichyl phosphate glucuronosyltransferase
MARSGMMISVLIATRNRAALLAATLEGLAQQEAPGQPVEIVIVDNGSTDDTAAVVARARERAPAPVIYLREERPGKSHALNTALSHVRGDLVVLTDDDVLPSPGWLAAYVRAFEMSDTDFVVGRILPLWEAPPPRWMSPALYGVLAVPDGGTRTLSIARGLNEHIMPLGANMAIRRRVVDRIGGWSPDLGKLEGTLRTGEDHEFGLRMLAAGFSGRYEPEACVRHRVAADRLRLGYFRKWFYDNGKIEAQLDRFYPTTNRYVFGVPGYLWRQAAIDVFSALVGLGTCDWARAAAGQMRALWFAGFLCERWRTRPNKQAAAAPVRGAIEARR